MASDFDTKFKVRHDWADFFWRGVKGGSIAMHDGTHKRISNLRMKDRGLWPLNHRCLRRGVWLGFDMRGCIRRLWMVDGRCQWDRHDAQCLRLQKLHSSSHILFHELSNLSLGPIIRPFLPHRLTLSAFTAFFLLGKANMPENDINGMCWIWYQIDKWAGINFCHHLSLSLFPGVLNLNAYWPHIGSFRSLTSTDDIGISVTSGTTAPAPPNLLMLRTCHQCLWETFKNGSPHQLGCQFCNTLLCKEWTIPKQSNSIIYHIVASSLHQSISWMHQSQSQGLP